MEVKPIKRSDSILKLSREHHFSLLFCWKLKQGLKNKVQATRIIPYVQYFLNIHLLPHFKEEEEILFVPIAGEIVSRAIEDHAGIRQLVQGLISYPDDHAAEQLRRLSDLLDKHIRFEERELFPHLEKMLSKEQLDDIGKRLAAPTVKDDYADEFWNTRPSSL